MHGVSHGFKISTATLAKSSTFRVAIAAAPFARATAARQQITDVGVVRRGEHGASEHLTRRRNLSCSSILRMVRLAMKGVLGCGHDRIVFVDRIACNASTLLVIQAPPVQWPGRQHAPSIAQQISGSHRCAQSHLVLNAAHPKITCQKRNKYTFRPDDVEFATGRRHDKRLTSLMEILLTVPAKIRGAGATIVLIRRNP